MDEPQKKATGNEYHEPFVALLLSTKLNDPPVITILDPGGRKDMDV